MAGLKGIQVKHGYAANGLEVREQFRDPEKMEWNFLDDLMQFLIAASAVGTAIIHGIIYSTYRAIARFFVAPVSLKGRVCVVTGSGRGFGRELSLQLAKEGAQVACLDVNGTTNSQTIDLIEMIGGTAKAFKVNVAVKEEADNAIQKIEKEMGPIYLLVNNAAIVLPQYPPSEDYVRASFNVNTLGPYWMWEAALPLMKSRNEGHIVNMASIAAHFNVPIMDIYCATKSALHSLSSTLALKLQLEGSKIKVTTLYPSFMNTSEDYKAMAQSKIKFFPMEKVLSDAMDAIKYGRQNVTSPGYMKFVIFLWLLPVETVRFLFSLYKSTVLLPNRAEYEKLPTGNLVKVGLECKKA